MRRAGPAVLPAWLPLLLWSTVAFAAGDDLAARPCPGADAWYAAHPQATDAARASRDAARIFTDSALRAELDARFERDQAVRRAWLARRADQQRRRAVVLMDEANLRWLHELVAGKGFPTAAQVGEEGVERAWLLLQHADAEPQFQASLLPVLERRHADGEFDGDSLARFTDRILKAQGQPQRYGTQFSPEAWHSANYGLPDEASVRQVDASRRALGIMPLADYVCRMSVARTGHP